LIVCALVPVAGGAGPSASDLRQRGVQLSARSHAAVLELYSLDSQLSGARARLASARSEAARVRALRANVALRLGIARHVLAVSNRALADRLRVLYEQGEADPMAILLGAQSLDEAVTRLDDLRSAAVQDETVISQTREARRSLLRLRGALAARQRHLDALAGEARAAVAQLERTRAARSAYVARLRAEEQLNSTRLTAVQSRAAAAAHKAAQLSAVPSSSAPAPGAPPAVGAAPVAGGRTLTVLATGYSLTGTTSTGLPVGWGVAAVDPSVIPLGTHMTVPGYGEAVAADTGGNVGGAAIDLWFPSAAKALAWGRRSVTITLH
jgi:peptidoglycan DL-endopeptidase CwlO